MHIEFLNIGGGIGVRYHRELVKDLDEYASKFMRNLKNLKVKIILEPGRVIVANTAVLLTKVIATKRTPSKNFVIVDAGMNDLLRPSMYGAYHEVVPATVFKDRRKTLYTIVGPICESGDVLAKRRFLPQIFPGELLAVKSVGAYGYSMSSNYNLRPRPAEILVDRSSAIEIRKREKIEDII
jgi:diaminopimelate decarboxylase